MDLGLTDRIALVAGSSQGIGFAIAAALAREGARVVLSGRRAAALDAAKRSLEAQARADAVQAFQGDLTEPAEISRCVEQVAGTWGDIEILVANIGSGAGTRGLEASDGEWERLWRTNLLGSVRVVRACVPGMLRRSGGSVVLIGSIAGLEALPAPLGYSAAKAALNAFGGTLARELAPQGIRVNTVAPGNIVFPGGSWDQRQATDPDGVARYLAAEVPMKRFGRPEEIADVAVFLASPRASFVVGAVVTVDGAQTRAFAS